MTNTIFGLIPARGNSKSVPRKNIAPVAGKPLIAWSIEPSLSCPLLDRVIVSTDDLEIAHVASEWGAEVPFLRPADLAQDDTPGIAPVLHAVRWLAENQNYMPEYVMVLQPTSPLRTQADITSSIQLALEKQADSVISVCSPKHHPYWMKCLDSEGQITNFLSLDPAPARRQDLPAVYALNGALYIVRCSILLTEMSFYTHKTYAYIMPEERSLDIDSPWDLQMAHLILTHQYRNGEPDR